MGLDRHLIWLFFEDRLDRAAGKLQRIIDIITITVGLQQQGQKMGNGKQFGNDGWKERGSVGMSKCHG